MADHDRDFITNLNKEAKQLAEKHKLPQDVVALFEKINEHLNETAHISVHYMHECHLFTNLANDLETKFELNKKLKLLCEDSGYQGAVGFSLVYKDKREKNLAFIHGRGKEKFKDFMDEVWQSVEKLRHEYGQELFLLGKLKYEERRKRNAEKTA